MHICYCAIAHIPTFLHTVDLADEFEMDVQFADHPVATDFTTLLTYSGLKDKFTFSQVYLKPYSHALVCIERVTGC